MMKLTFLINQEQIYRAGLCDQTSIEDWVLLEYIYDAPIFPSAVFYEGHVMIACHELQQAIPLIKFAGANDVLIRLRHLKGLGLITLKSRSDIVFAKTTGFYCDVAVASRMGQ
jgi:hypothetical protein